MIDSNKGEKGIPSIRLNGKRIEDLPIAESAGAQSQLPTVRETERQNRIAVVLSRYPRGSLAYYESRVRESRENISRMARTRSGLQHKIEEYQLTIGLCRHRERLEEAIPAEHRDRDKKILALRNEFPPYDVAAMEQQIAQFRDGMEKCDAVVETESNSLAQLEQVIGQCKIRDKELKALNHDSTK